MKVLVITSDWPNDEHPNAVPFLVKEVNNLKKKGLDIDIFSFKGRKKIRNFIIAWFKVRYKIWLGSYDIIHAHWGYNGILAFPTKIPLVVTYRGDDVNGIDYLLNNVFLKFYNKILLLVSKFVSAYAKSVIVVSENFLEMLTIKNDH